MHEPSCICEIRQGYVQVILHAKARLSWMSGLPLLFYIAKEIIGKPTNILHVPAYLWIESKNHQIRDIHDRRGFQQETSLTDSVVSLTDFEKISHRVVL